MKVNMTVKRRIVFNGKEYDSIEELPEGIRRTLENASTAPELLEPVTRMQRDGLRTALPVIAWVWVLIGVITAMAAALFLLQEGLVKGGYNGIFLLFGLLLVWSALALLKQRRWARYIVGACACIVAGYFLTLILAPGVSLGGKLGIGAVGLFISVTTLVLLPALTERV